MCKKKNRNKIEHVCCRRLVAGYENYSENKGKQIFHYGKLFVLARNRETRQEIESPHLFRALFPSLIFAYETMGRILVELAEN